MANEMNKKASFNRPVINALKQKINEISDRHEALSKQHEKVIDQLLGVEKRLTAAMESYDALAAKLAEAEKVIYQQAERIRELERENEINLNTLQARQEELDELYGRSLWKRIFNMM